LLAGSLWPLHFYDWSLSMYVSNESLLVLLLVGLIAGWLAGELATGGGFGLVGDTAVGVVGALIGTWLLPRLGIHFGGGIVNAIIVATIGAVALLLILGLLGGRIPRQRWRFLRRRHWRL
jgi:uncharacterized membrane protein YeaQ/YmgE (transglycosylase-associated protein family)